MKRSTAGNIKPIMGKLMIGFVLAVLSGSLDAAPAFARDDRGHGERHDNRRYDTRGHEREYYRDRHGRRVYRTTVYRERVYVPPPVIYAPPPPPGIGIFFPSIIIR